MLYLSLEKYRLKLFLAGVLSAAAVLPPSFPASAAPLDADMATVEACLSLIRKNQEARGPHEPDELTEKIGPKGRLGAARDAAPMEAESCIRVVATACIQAAGNLSNATYNQCYGRETDVWDARLNAAYKKLLANGDGEDVAEGFRKTQRAWIAYRDASCAQAWLVFKGTMANPIGAYCRMEKTARQALWLEGWLR
jgi:uncharacterized protein YecT (DUF1311 family)